MASGAPRLPRAGLLQRCVHTSLGLLGAFLARLGTPPPPEIQAAVAGIITYLHLRDVASILFRLITRSSTTLPFSPPTLHTSTSQPSQHRHYHRIPSRNIIRYRILMGTQRVSPCDIISPLPPQALLS